MSNWNRETLDAKQIEYAANDAYVSKTVGWRIPLTH